MPMKEQASIPAVTNIELKLLTQAEILTKKYKELGRLTGSSYNVFKILKLDSSETRLHSAFIADLLNPSGTHEQGSVFLKLFLKAAGIDNFQFDAESAIVQIEKFIGLIDDNFSNGGIIDIYLTDKNRQQIFIENKIYAGDQKNQLLRYSNHNKKALLIYLCLKEKEVDAWSCADMRVDKEFYLRTYQKHILAWLDECKKGAINLPILRETLSQYISTIKLLTGKETSEDMKQELAELIAKDKDSFKAAFSIADSIDTACNLLLPKLEALVKEIGTELDLKAAIEIDWKRKYSGFSFYKQEWKTCTINFQFQNFDTNMIFGLCRDNEELNLKDQITVDVFNRCKQLGGSFDSWWPFFKKMEAPFYDWYNKEAWLGVMDGSIKTAIKDKVELILRFIKDYPL